MQRIEMSILSILVNKVVRLILGIFGGFRRALCCFRRRRRNSGTPLPISTKYPTDQVSDLQSWETWNDDDGPISVQVDGNICHTSSQSNSLHRNSWSENNPQESGEHDLDFFKDMVPEIKRPKKVLVRQQAEEPPNASFSSRLALDMKAPIALSPELGVIDDVGGSWEDAAASEDAWDADQVLREKKREEKERKLAEHQRRKQEKEGRKYSKVDISFSATKLS